MTLSKIKEIISKGQHNTDDYAKALYSLILRIKYAKNLNFTEWEEVQQNIIAELYLKKIPKLDGRNDYAVLSAKIGNLLVDELRKRKTYCKHFTPLTDVISDNAEFKPTPEMSDEDALALIEKVEKDGNLDDEQLKRAERLKRKYSK